MKSNFTIIVIILIFVSLITPSISHAQIVELGTGVTITGTSTPSPINIYYGNSYRSQMVYTASELNAAGVSDGKIVQMALYIEETPLYDLPNFTVKMRHTTATNASSHDAGALTTVYSTPSYSPIAGGFDALTLDTPFDWNGTDNILVDICFEPTTGTSASGRIRYYSTSNGYRYVYGNSNVCGSATLYGSTRKPQMQFTFGGNTTDDAGVSNISVASCVGSNPISAMVFNAGSNQIANVDVHWTINGVAQSTVNYATLIDTIGSASGYTANVVLGSVNLAALGGSASIQVWTALPNGNADGNIANDTSTIELKAGLGGTYTIGGASPDFLTIQEAADSLRNNGVCDNVIFNIRTGTYTEQVLLEDFSNPNHYTVTFQSETNNKNDVTITYTSISNSLDYIIQLDNASNIYFRDLTFRALSTSYNTNIDIRNGSENTKFNDCQFRAAHPSYDALVKANVGNPNNLFLYDCNFHGGGYGVLYSHSSTGDSIYVLRNTFYQQYYEAVSINRASNVNVSDNHINGEGTTSSSFDGIYIYSCDHHLNIYNNTIFNINSGYGLNLQYNDGDASESHSIYNNFIHLTGTGNGHGIRAYDCDYNNLYHNTINNQTTGNTGVGLSVYYGNNNQVFNNNIVKETAGYAIYTLSSSNIAAADNNNYYTTGAAITGYLNSANSLTLADWITASSLDSNSLTSNPYFANDTSYVTNQVFLNNIGASIGIATDIAGTARNVATPDIGAYEFTPTGIDASIVEVVTPPKPFYHGVYDVKVILQNSGGTTLTSAIIQWSANGVAQPPVPWAGSLNTGDTITVTLGSINFGINEGYDFVVNSTNPNGSADAFPVNDTASISDVYGALAGLYTIGGASPDFPTFTEAATQLNLGGVVGATTMAVRDGTYNEQFTLTEICGADSANTVTFESELLNSTNCILDYSSTTSSDRYTVFLDGTDWVTLRHMTIKNSSATYRRVFEIGNEANHLTFENNLISNTASNTTSTNSALMFYHNTADEYQNYTNNTFENGSYAIYGDGTTNGGNNLLGDSIVGNLFQNQYYSGIYFEYADGIVVDSNIIKTTSPYSNFSGIQLSNCEDGIEITQNQIYGFSGVYGIYLNDCDGISSNHNLIANNFIKTGGTSNSTRGISIYYSNYTDIYHNSINQTNTGTTSRALEVNNGSNIRLANNIIRAETGYVIYSTTTSAITSSDYNNFYNTGINLGYWNGIVSDLAAWQAASSQDANSIFEDPVFLTDSTFTINNSSLNDAGTPIASVTTDIEGEPRNGSTPDIGADEFTLTGTDAGIAFITPPAAPFAPTSQLSPLI